MKGKDAYRLDNRTRAEFAADIRDGNRLERELMERWIRTIGNPSFVDAGCNNEGEYLDIEDVDMSPDFKVDGIGFVEVKFCRPLAPVFHLKVSQVEHYIEQDAQILMVIGTDTDTPKHTLISVDDLDYLLSECEHVSCRQFGGKEAIRVPTDWIQNWRHLP